MPTIPLSGGRAVALVDEQDHADLARHRWSLCGYKGSYAGRSVADADGKYRTLYMHRAIMRATAGTQIDHANRDTLDNRRANLRFCTQALNNANSQPWKQPASGFRGVYWEKSKALWRVRICVNGMPKSCGYYRTAIEAAHVYDTVASAVFGEFATLNFPLDGRK